MSYRLAGGGTDFCSCNTPCPCAFGQEPTRGTCKGLFCFDIQEGELDGSVRERLEPEGCWTAVRDELADLFRAHNQSADGARAYPGEYLVTVGRRTERGG